MRHVILLLASIIAGGRIVEAMQAWRAWYLWQERDPSAADAYRTFALVDTVVAVLSLAIAGFVWGLLRPKSRTPSNGND